MEVLRKKRKHDPNDPQPGTSSASTPMDVDIDLSPETSLRLFEEGATLIFLNVPPGTEVGIDLESWNTGNKFKGIKMIPPGVHFIHFSTVGRDGVSQAPRTGFYHNFKRGEILLKKYDERAEDIVVEVPSDEELARYKGSLKDLDASLGAYPYKSWRKWVSLSNKVSQVTVTRLSPPGGRICSAPELILDADQSIPVPQKRMTQLETAESQLPKMTETEDSRIRYSTIPDRTYDAATATAEEITKHNRDWSHKLEIVIQSVGVPAEVLAELQFSFLCFLVAQNYNSFEHWKNMIQLICYSDEAVCKYPNLYIEFLSDLYFEMGEVQDDLFTDIVTQNNFIYVCLKKLFENIRDAENVESRLRGKAERFESFFKRKVWLGVSRW